MAKLRAVECREFIKAVIAKSEQVGVAVSIAVVGPEGHLIALERMDDAGFITPEIAWSKAYTAVAFRALSPNTVHLMSILRYSVLFVERRMAHGTHCCGTARR